MGGKALSKYGVETERKTTPEFLKIAEYFQNKIEKDLGLETHIIEFFRQKETHGDLDVLIKLDRADVNLKKYIEDNIETKAINNNNGVVSFEYDNFQIDFIPIKPIDWESSKIYMDFDPTGNLMGKTAKMFKFDI
jgi:DNA polymerase/3'-5' exonuclease PolX